MCCAWKTTIAKTKAFKVLRPLQRNARSPRAWRALRTGIADLHRRAQVSQRANDNYLDALAAVDDDTPLHLLLDRVSRPVTYHGQRVRALRIGDPKDLALLAAIARGEFATAGFRNRDLRDLRYGAQRDSSSTGQRKLSARISRPLRLLRAHRVIRKIPAATATDSLSAGIYSPPLFSLRASPPFPNLSVPRLPDIVCSKQTISDLGL